MSIRVTNSFIINQSVSDINRNMKLLQDLQYQLSTGYRINRPSDDPTGVIQAIRLKNSLEQTKQHKVNIDDGRGRISASIEALSRVEDLLVEIQGKAWDSVNSLQSAGRSILASDINGLLNEIMINANAKYLGKYLFGAHESITAPFSGTYVNGEITRVDRNRLVVNGQETLGIDEPIYHTVDEGLDFQINISGSRPFMPNGEGGLNDIFTTIINIRDALESNDMSAVKGMLDDLDSEFENIVNSQTVLGQNYTRMQSILSSNEEKEIIKQESLSNILNVDMVKAIIDYNYQQSILQSSLQVGAKIIPMSLLDFI